MEIKVLEFSQAEEVMAYEKARLSHLSLEEQELAVWDAVWREESLEHYLPQGWSFGAWEEGGQLVGYCLAQPFLFFRGMTQTLWVEHMAFDVSRVGQSLVDVIVGWGRSKHMQKVLFRESDQIKDLKGVWELKKISGNELEVLTTKMVTF